MDLLQGERVIWAGRPTWRAMLAFYIKWGFFALVALVAGYLLRRSQGGDEWFAYGGAAAAIIVLLVILLGWLKRVDTHYTVTNRRLVVRKGIVSRNEQSGLVERIQNVNVSQGVIQRLLNVGTVEFDTASDDSDFRFEDISDPGGLRQRIDEELNRRDLTAPNSLG